MTSEFLLPFGQLDLASFNPEKREEVVEKCELLAKEAVEIFDFKRNNDEYWIGAKLQVVSKALPIAEALSPRYYETSHSVYAKAALQIIYAHSSRMHGEIAQG